MCMVQMRGRGYKLLTIINKLNTDLEYVRLNIEKRKTKVIQDTGEDTGARYGVQKATLESDMLIVSGWEV